MSKGARVQLRKEFRALLPIWAAVVVGLGLTGLRGPGPDMGLGLALYAAGAVALSALSIGQELTWRTTATLLAQPARRATLGLYKVVSLATLLALLGAVAALALPNRPRDLRALADIRADLWFFPLLSGLCLAPWLTMLSRSAIAGTVFTLAIPGLLWIAGLVVARLVFGMSPDDQQPTDAFRLAFFRSGLLALCAVGGFAGWRMFLQLEVADNQASAAGVPRWVTRLTSALRGSRVTRRPRHPLAALAGKELRLHQFAFALAALYLVGYVAIVTLVDRPQATAALNVFTFLYGPVVALMAAAAASAEERSLGVLEAQLLTPLSARVQWTVKAGTVAVLSALLAIALPYALSAMFGVAHDSDTMLALSPAAIGLSMGAGLYISSISQSFLRVIIATPLALLASLAAAGLLARPIRVFAWEALVPLFSPVTMSWSSRITGKLVVFLATVAAVTILALVFAARNHRTLDRPRGRIVRQILLLACVAALGATALAVVDGVYFARH